MPPPGFTVLSESVGDALIQVDRQPAFVVLPDGGVDLDAPLVSGADPAAHVFPSANDPQSSWWLPVPQLDPGGFVFEYRTTGADAAAVPTIAARVTVVMRWVEPPDLDGTLLLTDTPLKRIPIAAVDVTLAVPFVDAATNQLTFAQLPMSATFDEATLTCTVEIVSGIARAAYGALSVEGFQTQPATITVGTHFGGIIQGKVRPGAVSPGGVEEDIFTIPPHEFLIPVDPDDDDDGPRPEEIGRIREHVVVFNPETTIDVVPTRGVELEASALRVPLHQRLMGREEMLTRHLAPATTFAGERLRDENGMPHTSVIPAFVGQDAEIVNMATIEQRATTLPVLVPCRDRPQQFREDPGDGSPPQPVGCQDPKELGIAPSQRFVRLPEFTREGRYQVWESQQMPDTYVVAPVRYRVARAPTPVAGGGSSGRPQGSPVMVWTEVFDATQDAGLPCRLYARCVPDLPPHELAELGERLRARAGRRATLLVPTSTAAGASGVTVAGTTLTGGTPQVVTDGAELAIALPVSYSDAVVVSEQLRGGEAVVQVNFDMGDDRIRMSTTVRLDVRELAGPWPAGPVKVSRGVQARRLTNEADTAATVSAIWTTTSAGGWSRSPLEPALTLAAGASADVPPDVVVSDEAVAEAQFALGDAELAVRSIFLEDLHTRVLLRRDVDLAAQGIERLELTMSISNVPQATIPFPAALERLEVTLVQPLVAAREAISRELTVTASVVNVDGTVTARRPVLIDLSKGVVVLLSKVLG